MDGGACAPRSPKRRTRCVTRLRHALVALLPHTSIQRHWRRSSPLTSRRGVRLIGIGEVARRIVGKAVLPVTEKDIQGAAGTLQLCAGQECGIKAAIHAMHDVYREEDADAILLANVSNAFNRLNREACLRNIRHFCPYSASCHQHLLPTIPPIR